MTDVYPAESRVQEPCTWPELRDRALRAVREARIRKTADVVDTVLAVLGEEAVNRMTAQFLEDVRIRSMDCRNGVALDLEPSRELVALWVGAARGMLGEAPNYTETEIDLGLADPPGVEMDVRLAGEGEHYVFRLQRRGKLTPHQARIAAEARADEAEAKLARLRAVLLEGGQSLVVLRQRTLAIIGDSPLERTPPT